MSHDKQERSDDDVSDGGDSNARGLGLPVDQPGEIDSELTQSEEFDSQKTLSEQEESQWVRMMENHNGGGNNANHNGGDNNANHNNASNVNLDHWTEMPDEFYTIAQAHWMEDQNRIMQEATPPATPQPELRDPDEIKSWLLDIDITNDMHLRSFSY